MGKRCYRCGSDDLIKVVSARSLVIPEIKQAVAEGLAEVSCGCAGFQTGHRTKCRNCGFVWDDLMEAQLEQNRRENE